VEADAGRLLREVSGLAEISEPVEDDGVVVAAALLDRQSREADVLRLHREILCGVLRGAVAEERHDSGLLLGRADRLLRGARRDPRRRAGRRCRAFLRGAATGDGEDGGEQRERASHGREATSLGRSRVSGRYKSAVAGFRYVVADVFTDEPLTGNQVAVFTDGREIPEERLQPIAKEMAFSETVFVYPAE